MGSFHCDNTVLSRQFQVFFIWLKEFASWSTTFCSSRNAMCHVGKVLHDLKFLWANKNRMKITKGWTISRAFVIDIHSVLLHKLQFLNELWFAKVFDDPSFFVFLFIDSTLFETIAVWRYIFIINVKPSNSGKCTALLSTFEFKNFNEITLIFTWKIKKFAPFITKTLKAQLCRHCLSFFQIQQILWKHKFYKGQLKSFIKTHEVEKFHFYAVVQQINF